MGAVVLAFLTALALSLVATPACEWLARRLGILDQPAERKLHRTPTPLLGGVAVYVSFAVATLAFARPVVDFHVQLLLLGAAAFAWIGVLDDVHSLLSVIRLAVEGLVVSLIVWAGDLRAGLPWPYLGHLLAVVWVVGVANAVNCLDCADGTAAGAAAMSSLALAAFAALWGRWAVAAAAAALCGASLGFLRYNFPPARIFLGDSGSLVLGFLLGALAAATATSLRSAQEVVALGVILALPVLDFLLVHWRRYRGGIRSLLALMASTGKDHLPHRLLAAGFSPTGVALRVSGASAFLGVAGLSWALGGPPALVLLGSLTASLAAALLVWPRAGAPRSSAKNLLRTMGTGDAGGN